MVNRFRFLLLQHKTLVMQNERREAGSPAQQHVPTAPLQAEVVVKKERPGPISFAVNWLGGAFDRCQMNKREAEERRRRFM